MANINGKSPIVGSVRGSWTQGASAYQIWIQDGHSGSRSDFLESLKAFSPQIGNITESEEGTTFTITDENGSHEIFISRGKDGKDITIDSSVVNDDGNIVITFSDDSQIIVPRGIQGQKGEDGVDGREVVLFVNNDGVIRQKYDGDQDAEATELIDLDALTSEKVSQELDSRYSAILVSQLPDPNDALPGMIYVVREEEG